jgi:guanylate kinase
VISELSNQKVLVIIGPSGSGKSFLVKQLVEKYPFKLVLSTTTRAMRPGEVQNLDMHFVTPVEYTELQEQNAFFSDFNNFGAQYGYLRSSVQSIVDEGLIPVAIVYTTIVPYFYREFPDTVFSIFLYPTNVALLEERMVHRGDSAESIKGRLASAQKEIHDYESDLKQLVDVCIEITDDHDIYRAVDHIRTEYNLSPSVD